MSIVRWITRGEKPREAWPEHELTAWLEAFDEIDLSSITGDGDIDCDVIFSNEHKHLLRIRIFARDVRDIDYVAMQVALALYPFERWEIVSKCRGVASMPARPAQVTRLDERRHSDGHAA